MKRKPMAPPPPNATNLLIAALKNPQIGFVGARALVQDGNPGRVLEAALVLLDARGNLGIPYESIQKVGYAGSADPYTMIAWLRQAPLVTPTELIKSLDSKFQNLTNAIIKGAAVHKFDGYECLEEDGVPGIVLWAVLVHAFEDQSHDLRWLLSVLKMAGYNGKIDDVNGIMSFLRQDVAIWPEHVVA